MSFNSIVDLHAKRAEEVINDEDCVFQFYSRSSTMRSVKTAATK